MVNNFKEYDKGLDRLNQIVNKLENEELSLEENIKLYEEGVKLHSKLKKILKEAEGRIVKIQEGKELSDYTEMNFLDEE